MTDLMINIKKLREITGAGFLDCKKSLEENNNNIDDSIDFLRKKGLAKANKKSSREANEGAVGIYSNEVLTCIIQINTETDFAAKNEVFLNFMDEIGSLCIQNNNTNLSIDEFKNMTVDEISIGDKFKNIIAKIGENIILTKLICISKDNNSMISTYIHNNYKNNIGKIAVVLKSEVETSNDESKTLGKNLCMHIAALKPLAMDVEGLDINLIEKERNLQLETIKSSGKPDNIIDKILEGKMKKFFSESVLLDQEYILDSDKSVSKVISEFSKKNKFKIVSYNLLVLES